MADKDDRVETETTAPIADEHEDVRRRFVELWNELTSGDAGALAAAWQPVATLLEVPRTCSATAEADPTPGGDRFLSPATPRPSARTLSRPSLRCRSPHTVDISLPLTPGPPARHE
jgi:hypothetical protein